MEKIYLHPGHHAGYYPGPNPISLKLIFRRDDGRIVSAQAFGKEGVERRIDVIAMTIQKRPRCSTWRKRSCATRPLSARPRTPSTWPA